MTLDSAALDVAHHKNDKPLVLLLQASASQDMLLGELVLEGVVIQADALRIQTPFSRDRLGSDITWRLRVKQVSEHILVACRAPARAY